MGSINFNGTDLSSYGVVTRATYPASQNTAMLPVRDTAIAGLTSLQSRVITLEISVSGSTYDEVQNNLDSIKSVLNNRNTCPLIISTLPDRFWDARFESIQGQFIASRLWSGYLTFVIPDPLAYSITEIESEHTIGVL